MRPSPLELPETVTPRGVKFVDTAAAEPARLAQPGTKVPKRHFPPSFDVEQHLRDNREDMLDQKIFELRLEGRDFLRSATQLLAEIDQLRTTLPPAGELPGFFRALPAADLDRVGVNMTVCDRLLTRLVADCQALCDRKAARLDEVGQVHLYTEMNSLIAQANLRKEAWDPSVLCMQQELARRERPQA